LQLAWAFHAKGYKVGFFSLDQQDVLGDFFRLSNRSILIDENGQKKLIPSSDLGLKLVLGSHLQLVTEKMSFSLVDIPELIQLVDWGALDFLIIDLPHLSVETELKVLRNINLCGVLLVTTPLSILKNKIASVISGFRSLNIPIVGFVENNSHFIEPLSKITYYPFGSGMVEKMAKKCGVSFFGEIPLNDSALYVPLKTGPISRSYRYVASRILDCLSGLDQSRQQNILFC
jgi:ATP-binding protein involved in chromosome partitioning